jgi:N-acyl-D-aspartate/D-glutamate deacylase
VKRDIVIRGGHVLDGSGSPGFDADVAIDGDRIAAVGSHLGDTGLLEIDARGLAVAPGFINMLSWATESLLVDGRSQSDLRQGVTLEVMGEGSSMGPLTPEMREAMLDEQGDLRFEVPWTTLGEYLEHLIRRGVSTNVASFVGATTVRVHELGRDDRPPTLDELSRMRGLVRAAMAEGAMGVGSSLIYAPAFYASTDELVALATEAGAAGGMYISHIRSEGARLGDGVAELLEIARLGACRAEIYHFKALGEVGQAQFDDAVDLVVRAREAELAITADVYPYTAAATGLDAAMPPWVQEGGLRAWIARLRDPDVRARVIEEMRDPDGAWENQVLLSGGAGGVMLAGFRNERLKPLTGMTLEAIAASRSTSPEEAAIDLVIEDESHVSTTYFNQSEDVLRQVLALPFTSVGSDGASVAPEGAFLRSNPHPRTYGTFARVLARYVRAQKLLTLEEAVRRMTSLPADNLRLRDRGRLAVGANADVVIFDPTRIQDHATFDAPHQYATGVRDVLVNGVPTLRDGEHTGALAGRVVRGPGFVPSR